MKSFFTKLGGLLLCGVMFIAVGCHDYSEDIQDGDKAVLEQIDAAKADLAKQVADVKTTIEGLDKKYEALGNVEKAVAALKTELETEISEAIAGANAEISSLKAALADKASKGELTTLESNLKAKLSEEVKALESKITAATTAMTELLKSYATTQYVDEAIKDFVTDAELAEALKAYATADDFQALFEMIYGEDGMYETLEGKIQALETAVEDLAAAEDLEIVEGKVSDLEETVKTLVDDLAALKESVKANTDAVAELKDKVSTIETTLAEKADKTALESLEASIKDLLDAKVDQSAYDEAAEQLKKVLAEKADKETVNKAIEDFKAALATKVEQAAFDKALETVKTNVAELQSTMDANDAKLQASIDEVKGELTTLVNNYKSEMEDVYANIKNLMAELERLNKVEVSIAELQQLFARIQSVVYKPTHADGKARVNYATVENKILEGYSEITYKVYPANCAETIVKAFSNTENKLSLTFDAIEVKSVASKLEVVEAFATAAGDLTLVYKSNLGEPFFNDVVSYSAALVLEFDGENAQNFSTEYTNFVKGQSKEYNMVLYSNGVAFSAQSYEWPYVAAGKTYTKNILDTVEPRFISGAEVLTPAQFAALGYDAEYQVSATAESNEVISVGITPDQEITACLAEEANKANVNTPTITATKTFKWAAGEKTLDAVATLSVVDFEYTLSISAKTASYHIPYTEKEAEVVANLENLDVKFVNKNNASDVLSIEQVTEKFPAIQVLSRFATSYEDELFDITGETYAASVKLNSEVVAGDVYKKVRFRYYFYSPVLDEEVGGHQFVDVIIDPQTYHFYLAEDTYAWTYANHADVDAARYKGDAAAKYVYSNEAVKVLVEKGAIVQEDVVLSEILKDATYEVKIGENKVETPYTVSFGSEDNAEVVKVKFEGMEWGKKYEILARGEVPSGKFTTNDEGKQVSVPGAVAYVHFTLNTVDRSRNAVTFTAEPIEFNFAKDLNVTTETALSLAGLYENLLKAGNLDADANAQTEYLQDATFVSNAISWGEGDAKKTTANATSDSWVSKIITDEDLLAANAYKVGYKANLVNVENGYIVKEFTYSKTLTTWYGQVICIEQPVKLLDPVYDFSVVPQYIKGDAATGYYMDVLPSYTYDGAGVMTAFSVQKVNLDGAFDVVDAEGNVLSKTQMDELGLVRTFALVNNTDVGIELNDALISYNGVADAVTVNGSLEIVNTNGTKFAIDETIFTGDYKTFEVRKFDPLAKNMTILEGKANQEIAITEAKKYTFAILDNYSLKDVLGNELIKGGNDGANDFVALYATEEVYDLTPSYTAEVYINGEKVNAPTGITVNATTGIITVDNTAQLQFANPVTVKVTAKITYPQDERTGETVTYIFK